MRSGSTWVATDYDSSTHQSQCFEFTATRVPNTRNVKIDWWMTTYSNDNAASPTYYLCRGVQNLIVNGVTMINWSGTNPSYRNSSGATVYYGFADRNSWLDNNYRNREFYDTNGDYTGIRRWVRVLGTRWQTGSFVKTADGNGDISFSVSGNFGWYNDSIRLSFSKTFTVKGQVPKATYKIKYNANNQTFISGNSAYNIPSEGIKTYNVNYNVSSQIPESKAGTGEHNYRFVSWTKSATNSFSGTTIYNPGDTYTTNSDLSLYALWTPVDKTIAYNFNTQRQVVNTKYNSRINALPATTFNRYGYSLVSWHSNTFNRTIIPSTSFICLGNEELIAEWKANKYIIHLADINGNVLPGRDIEATYDSVLHGNFTYRVPGYNVLGWSIRPYPVRNPGDAPLPIISNVPYIVSHKEGIYIGADDFTTESFKISDTEVRRHIIGQDITLYPVLEYSTSMYIYTTVGWKLAMPYVYTTSGWKQTLGNIYTNNWTK